MNFYTSWFYLCDMIINKKVSKIKNFPIVHITFFLLIFVGIVFFGTIFVGVIFVTTVLVTGNYIIDNW